MNEQEKITNTKKSFKTIDLQSYMCDSKLYSRLVWQVLFDEYTEYGGCIGKMDSMLCDLYSIERYFEKWRNSTDQGFSFQWSYFKEITEIQASDVPRSNEKYIEVHFNSNEVEFFRFEENK